jgi:hypothetical protein
MADLTDDQGERLAPLVDPPPPCSFLGVVQFAWGFILLRQSFRERLGYRRCRNLALLFTMVYNEKGYLFCTMGNDSVP